MKILKIAAFLIFLFIVFSFSSLTFSKNTAVYTTSVLTNTYDVRVCIEGKWYIITYNSDGYIVNIVEDDE